MKFTLYAASCRGNAKNTAYPQGVVVNGVEDLRAAVSFDHVAAKYSDFYRKAANFIEADCQMFDVDNSGGDDPANWTTPAHVWGAFPGVPFYVVYSRNHMREKSGKAPRPKFHVYFPDVSMTDGSEYRRQKEAVISYFPAFDANAKDTARFFFGVEAPQVEHYPGNVLLSDFMKTMPGAASPAQDSTAERRGSIDVSEQIPEGSRNDTLTRMAGSLRQMGCDRDAMLDALLALNERLCTTPLAPAEVEQIANSVARYQKGELPKGAVWDFNGAASVAVPKPAVKAICASDVEVKAVSWLWRDVLVQGGLNSIQGLAGIGKTFLLCSVSAAVSTGGRVQSVNGDFEKLPRGKVLYLSGDDDIATTIVPRLNTFDADLNNIHFAPQGILPPIGSPEFAQLFEAVKPSLVIVDTIQHFLPARTDLNSANGTTVALQPLKVLAEQYNCSVVIIQHISKISASGNGGYSVNFGIGSAAVNGLFRSVWTLGRLKDDDGKASMTRALSPSKTNLVAGDPPSILFDLSMEGGFKWAGIDGDLTAEQLYNPTKNPAHRPGDLAERVKDEILNVLGDATQPMRSEELQQRVIDATGCSERTYKTARKKAGVISAKAGDVWYSSLPKET